MFFVWMWFFFLFFFYHDYSVRKSLVCVYVYVNILSRISRVAQLGLLYVLSPVAIGACAPCIASLWIILLKFEISPSWAPACFPLPYPQHPSITTFSVRWMLSSPVSKASPAPWCLQRPVLCPLSPGMLCQEWDRGCGFAAELWGAVALLGDQTSTEVVRELHLGTSWYHCARQEAWCRQCCWAGGVPSKLHMALVSLPLMIVGFPCCLETPLEESSLCLHEQGHWVTLGRWLWPHHLCQGCEKSRCKDVCMPWLTSGLRFPAFLCFLFFFFLSRF